MIKFNLYVRHSQQQKRGLANNYNRIYVKVVSLTSEALYVIFLDCGSKWNYGKQTVGKMGWGVDYCSVHSVETLPQKVFQSERITLFLLHNKRITLKCT